MPTITIPHLYRPREYQLPFLQALDSGIKRAVIIWNRRSGKDKTCFNFMVKEACTRVGTYFYLLPSFSQGKKVIWDNIDNDGFKMLDHIPRELIKSTNGTELKVELLNGSIIQLMAANEFKNSGVGTNPVGVVFSEYPLCDPEAWKFLAPILAANGGWAIFNGTPRGKNHAWELLQMAKDNPKWFTQVLTVDDTKVFTEEDLEEERRNNPQDFFEQEYYCKFVDGAGQFFRNVEACVKAINHLPNKEHQYLMGVDLAKYQDYTVITVIDLMTFEVVELERFNQIDWNLQKAKIEAAYLRYGKPLTYIDSTGVGDPIFDDLYSRGMTNLRGYKFNEQSRRDLLVNLQLIFEQSKISIPNNQVLKDELSSMRYELVGNKTKIKVPDNLHDDTIFSLCLACWGLPNKPKGIISQSTPIPEPVGRYEGTLSVDGSDNRLVSEQELAMM